MKLKFGLPGDPLSQIRLLLFDVGNVLLRLKMDDFLGRVQTACPALTPAVMTEELRRPGGVHWLFEEGKASFDDFHAHLVKTYGLPWNRAEFLEQWLDYFSRNEPMDALVAEIAAVHFPMAVLSNTNEVHYNDFTVRYPVFRFLNPIIGSHQIGHRKPSRQAFEAALGLLGLPGSAIFYIDDLKANVEMAQEMGMTAYHYTFDDGGLRAALLGAGLL